MRFRVTAEVPSQGRLTLRLRIGCGGWTRTSIFRVNSSARNLSATPHLFHLGLNRTGSGAKKAPSTLLLPPTVVTRNQRKASPTFRASQLHLRDLVVMGVVFPRRNKFEVLKPVIRLATIHMVQNESLRNDLSSYPPPDKVVFVDVPPTVLEACVLWRCLDQRVGAVLHRKNGNRPIALPQGPMPLGYPGIVFGVGGPGGVRALACPLRADCSST